MATDIIARGMAAGVVSQVSADKQAVSEDRAAVETAKTEVLNVAESIPEDYSTLSADVGELKEDLSESMGFEKVSNTWQGTGLFHTDGSFVENSNFHYSVPIKLVKGQAISVYCFLTDVIFAKIFEVDESGNFVRNLVNNPVWSDYSQSEFLCQNDEMYVSYCARTGSNEDCIVKKYTELAKQFDLIKDKNEFNFTWITEFPLFEYNEEEDRYHAAHHPFTSPMDEDLDMLESNPGAVRSKAYDLVLNGYELLSGSIRIHDQDLQEKVFEAIGLSHEVIDKYFMKNNTVIGKKLSK